MRRLIAAAMQWTCAGLSDWFFVRGRRWKAYRLRLMRRTRWRRTRRVR
jgi:hypothetical protein